MEYAFVMLWIAVYLVVAVGNFINTGGTVTDLLGIVLAVVLFALACARLVKRVREAERRESPD